MPRYFFTLRAGDQSLEDGEGMTLPDAEAAWYQAVRQARELLSGDRSPALARGFVAICDEQGCELSKLKLSEVPGPG